VNITLVTKLVIKTYKEPTNSGNVKEYKMESVLWIIGGLAIGYVVVKAALLFITWLQKQESK